MTTVYLMRHGGVENPQGLVYGSLPGFPLSEAGRSQIHHLAEDLLKLDVRPHAIIASPLERAQQTALLTADILGMPRNIVSSDARLREWGMAAWVGRPMEDFVEHSGYYDTPPRMDGLEPLEEAASRVRAVIEENCERYADSEILIVSHREALASAILSFQGKSFDGIHKVDLPVASVWKGEFEGKTIKALKKVLDRHD